MYIVVDIGGTHARVAAYASPEDVLSLVTRDQFRIRNDYQQDIRQLIEMINAVAGGQRVSGLGVVVAGALDAHRTKVVKSGNLTDWVGHDLWCDLEEGVGTNYVQLANDAYGAAMAEREYGGHSTDAVVIVWGSGVGGSFLRLDDAADGTTRFLLPEAAEPGHVLVDPNADNPRCGCGSTGCLESFAGGAKLELKYPSAVPGRAWYEEMTDSQWRGVTDAFGVGLASLLNGHPASTVVFCGGISCKQSPRLKMIQQSLACQNLMADGLPEFKLAKFREDTGLVGALTLLK